MLFEYTLFDCFFFLYKTKGNCCKNHDLEDTVTDALESSVATVTTVSGFAAVSLCLEFPPVVWAGGAVAWCASAAVIGWVIGWGGQPG